MIKRVPPMRRIKNCLDCGCEIQDMYPLKKLFKKDYCKFCSTLKELGIDHKLDYTSHLNIMLKTFKKAVTKECTECGKQLVYDFEKLHGLLIARYCKECAARIIKDTRHKNKGKPKKPAGDRVMVSTSFYRRKHVSLSKLMHTVITDKTIDTINDILAGKVIARR